MYQQQAAIPAEKLHHLPHQARSTPHKFSTKFFVTCLAAVYLLTALGTALVGSRAASCLPITHLTCGAAQLTHSSHRGAPARTYLASAQAQQLKAFPSNCTRTACQIFPIAWGVLDRHRSANTSCSTLPAVVSHRQLPLPASATEAGAPRRQLQQVILPLAGVPGAPLGAGPPQITTGTELLQRINDTAAAADTQIVLTGRIRFDQDFRGRFPNGVRFAGRNVSLVGDPNNGSAVLDFGQQVQVMTVGTGGTLKLEGLTIRNTAPPYSQQAASVQYQTQQGTFPTIVFEPNTTFLTSNSTFYQYANNCSDALINASLPVLEQQFGQGITIGPGDTGPKILLPNVVTFTTPVRQFGGFASTSAPVGTLNIVTERNYIVCQPDAAAPVVALPSNNATAASSPSHAGGSALPWWAWVLIALGIAAGVVLLSGTAVVLWLRRRKKKTQRQQQQMDLEKGPMSQGVFLRGPGTPLGDSASKETSGDTNSTPQLVKVLLLRLAVVQDAQTTEYPLTDAARVALAREASSPEGLVLGKLVGRGGFGRVYKGRWKGVLVAVKVIDHGHSGSHHTKVTKPVRESQLANIISHPNVVATYQAWTLPVDRLTDADPEPEDEGTPALPPVPVHLARGDPHTPSEPSNESNNAEQSPHDADKKQLFQTWIVCEYMDKGCLRDAIRQGVFGPAGAPGAEAGTPSTRHMVSIYRTLVDIAAAMEYCTRRHVLLQLHGLGMVHGDLKSANILLRSSGGDSRGFTAKIADFGLSRVLDMSKSHTYTRSYGTMAYQPPELLANGKLTKSCDVYAFGMLMWELFTATEPYPGASLGQVFYTVVYAGARPPVPVECPADYTALIQRCWHAEPLERPTFDIIHKELRSMLQTTVASITISSIPRPLPNPSRGTSSAPAYQSLSGK